MPSTREKIDAELGALEAAMPRLLEEHPDVDARFHCAFANIADGIIENAGPEDREYVYSRISCILGEFGVIPSDNEGESCAPRPEDVPQTFAGIG